MLKAFFATAALALFALPANADSTTLNIDSMPSIVVERGGQQYSYRVDPSLQEMELYSDQTFLSMGGTTRCDPVLGQTVSDMQLRASAVSVTNETRGAPERVVIQIPAGTSVTGRCGSNSPDLIAVSFYRPNRQKFFLRPESAANTPTQEETAASNAEAARHATIAAALAETQQALAAQNFAEARRQYALVVHESQSNQGLSEAERALFAQITEAFPASELSVGSRVGAYRTEFQQYFGLDLEIMSAADFQNFLRDYANGSLQAANNTEAYLVPEFIIKRVLESVAYTAADQDKLASSLAKIAQRRLTEITQKLNSPNYDANTDGAQLRNSQNSLQASFEALASSLSSAESVMSFTNIARNISQLFRSNPEFIRIYPRYGYRSSLINATIKARQVGTLPAEFSQLLQDENIDPSSSAQ